MNKRIARIINECSVLPWGHSNRCILLSVRSLILSTPCFFDNSGRTLDWIRFSAWCSFPFRKITIYAVIRSSKPRVDRGGVCTFSRYEHECFSHLISLQACIENYKKCEVQHRLSSLIHAIYVSTCTHGFTSIICAFHVQIVDDGGESKQFSIELAIKRLFGRKRFSKFPIFSRFLSFSAFSISQIFCCIHQLREGKRPPTPAFSLLPVVYVTFFAVFAWFTDTKGLPGHMHWWHTISRDKFPCVLAPEPLITYFLLLRLSKRSFEQKLLQLNYIFLFLFLCGRMFYTFCLVFTVNIISFQSLMLSPRLSKRQENGGINTRSTKTNWFDEMHEEMEEDEQPAYTHCSMLSRRHTKIYASDQHV